MALIPLPGSIAVMLNDNDNGMQQDAAQLQEGVTQPLNIECHGELIVQIKSLNMINIIITS